MLQDSKSVSCTAAVISRRLFRNVVLRFIRALQNFGMKVKSLEVPKIYLKPRLKTKLSNLMSRRFDKAQNICF